MVLFNYSQIGVNHIADRATDVGYGILNSHEDGSESVLFSTENHRLYKLAFNAHSSVILMLVLKIPENYCSFANYKLQFLSER